MLTRPDQLLRIEGALALATAAIAYGGWAHGHWWVFAVLFLVPDVAMLGYVAGRRAGAAAYNAAHWYVLPAALLGIGIVLAWPWAAQLGLIWVAHIGFDRLLGFGLKYPDRFSPTHMQQVRTFAGAAAIATAASAPAV